jgi:WD40 repeat protein
MLCRLSSLLLVFLPLPALGQPVEPAKPQPAVRTDRHGDPLPPGALARLGTTRFRHQGKVNFVGYSGDGALLATAGTDALRIWDARQGKEIHSLALKPSMVRRFRFQTGPAALISGDGKTILTGVDDGDCSVIDVATGKVRRTFQVHQGGQAQFGGGNLAQNILSHDGRYLLIVEADQFGNGTSKINVWDTSAGKSLYQLTPKKKGQALATAAISPDGKSLLAFEGGQPNDKKDPGKATLRFLDMVSGRELRALDGPIPAGGDVKFTPDGKGLLMRGASPSIRLIDAGTLKELRSFSAKQGNARGMLLSGDQKSLFVAGANHVVHYDFLTGKELRGFPVSAAPNERFFGRMQQLSQFSMAVSPDGKTLAIPALATVAFWDLQTGKEIQTWQGQRDRIESVAFAPDGKRVLTGAADAGVYLWDVASGERLRDFVLKTPVQDNNNFPGQQMGLFHVRSAFSPDGKSVAGLRWGEKLHLWDTAGDKPARELGTAKGHCAFAFSADGKSLALLGPDGLELWDPATGKQRRSFAAPQSAAPQFGRGAQQIFSTAFSPDGRLLVSAIFQVEQGDGSLKTQVDFLELASGQKRMRFEARSDIASEDAVDFGAIMSALDTFIASFAFAPDGNGLAEAGFSNIKLRSLQSGKELRSFGGKQVVAASAHFSPDGAMLVAGKLDGSIRLWDVTTGTVLADFPAHDSPVTTLAFSPDGKLLATGTKDASVLVWEWDYIRKHATAAAPQATPVAHQRLWANLASEDAAKAYEAIKAMAGAPGDSVAFLKGKVIPVPPVDPGYVKSLLADLDHKQFAVRGKAEKALHKLGDLAAQPIRDQLARSSSLEMTRRLEKLSKALDAQVASAEVLQSLRAIEVLERIGSPAARRLLEQLAGGAAGHRVTEQARMALERMARRAGAGVRRRAAN